MFHQGKATPNDDDNFVKPSQIAISELQPEVKAFLDTLERITRRQLNTRAQPLVESGSN